MFKFVDLFAGIGGMRLGFDSLGGECVFSSEISIPNEIAFIKFIDKDLARIGVLDYANRQIAP